MIGYNTLCTLNGNCAGHGHSLQTCRLIRAFAFGMQQKQEISGQAHQKGICPVNVNSNTLLKVHAHVSNYFIWTFNVFPCIILVSSKCSVDTANRRGLVLVFAVSIYERCYFTSLDHFMGRIINGL